MLHILVGADTFSLKERLEEIKGSLGSPEMLDFSSQRLDGASVTVEQFASACQAMPFMVPRRLVIVEGLLDRFQPATKPAALPTPGEGITVLSSPESGSRGKSTDVADDPKKKWVPFAGIAKIIPETTILVLVDGEAKKNNPLLADLSGVAQVEPFPLLKDRDLSGWVQNRADKYGITLSAGIIDRLVDLVGSNLWVIDNELQKLKLYSRGQTVKLSDIEQIVGYSRESSIFQLVDAIIQRRTRRALELLQQLRNAGAEPPYILAMLTREVRRLVLAKVILAGRTIPQELARELRLQDERDLRFIRDKAGRYSQATLEDIYTRILRTDVAIKTGKGEADAAVELLIGEICGAAPLYASRN